jgi:hypothetical protein
LSVDVEIGKNWLLLLCYNNEQRYLWGTNEPYKTRRKHGDLDSDLSRERSSIVVVVTILLEKISGSDYTDCNIALISFF